MKKILLLVALTFGLSNVALSAKVEKLVETKNSWNGTELPAVKSENMKVTALRITIKAGEKLGVHKHGVINVGYLTKGQLTVTTEKGQVYDMKAGDQIVEVVEQWHYGENKGTTDAEIVVFYIGDEQKALTTAKQ